MKQRSGLESDGADRDARDRQLALFGVSLLRCHSDVSYGDVRFTSLAERMLAVKNGEVDRVTDGEDRGFGVRLLAGGCWGFAASSELSEEGAARTRPRRSTAPRAPAGREMDYSFVRGLLEHALVSAQEIRAILDEYPPEQASTVEARLVRCLADAGETA
jgi:hypothetical protein